MREIVKEYENKVELSVSIGEGEQFECNSKSKSMYLVCDTSWFVWRKRQADTESWNRIIISSIKCDTIERPVGMLIQSFVRSHAFARYFRLQRNILALVYTIFCTFWRFSVMVRSRCVYLCVSPCVCVDISEFSSFQCISNQIT